MRQPYVIIQLFASFFALTVASSAYASAPVAVPEGAFEAGAIDERDGASPRVEARLYLDHDAIAPGQTLTAGVLLTIDPHWHVYWRNSGESGLATRIVWEIEEVEGSAQTWSPMTWPDPEVFVQPAGPITTYGYAEEVMHTASVTLPDSWEGTSTLTIRAKVDYLTCRVECIPGSADLRRTIEVGAARPSDEASHALIEAWRDRVPRQAGDFGAIIEVTPSQNQVRPGDEIEAMVTMTCDPNHKICGAGWRPDDALGAASALIPDLAPNMTWRVDSIVGDDPPRVMMAGRASQNAPVDTTSLGGVLRLTNPSGRTLHVIFEHTLPMAPRDAPVTTYEVGEPDDSHTALAEGRVPVASEASDGEAPMSVWRALWLALLGGMLLNLMPCVFPVLTIKMAGLAQIAHHERGVMVRHGLSYAAGILVTMGAFAAVVIGMRVIFDAAPGWGFQFQNPLFLAILSGAMVLFAVNLFGAFEFSLPIDAASLGPDDDGAHGLRQSFGEGLLSVLLATPCSAPFMGTAVGFALVSEPLVIALIFLALGVGLALPFVLLCAAPAWTRWLPRPGPWLEKLKHLLGFSLLATTIWLVWLVGQSFGPDGMAQALVFCVALALAAWMYGAVQFGRSGWRAHLVQLAAGSLIVVSGWWALDFEGPTPAADTSRADTAEGSFTWLPFDEAAIARDVSAGRTVFVDFTADWCITCKVNERTVLASDAVIGTIREHGVVMYKADWTRRDDTIRAILARHGKGGVPMYLVYHPGAPDAPTLLPELLTESLVIEAIAPR